MIFGHTKKGEEWNEMDEEGKRGEQYACNVQNADPRINSGLITSVETKTKLRKRPKDARRSARQRERGEENQQQQRQYLCATSEMTENPEKIRDVDRGVCLKPFTL
jgi:hypothetical protein